MAFVSSSQTTTAKRESSQVEKRPSARPYGEGVPTADVSTPSELKVELTELLNKAWEQGLPPLKPWPEFVAKFTPPTKADIISRVHTNLIYFPTNYFIVAAVVFAVNMIWNMYGMIAIILCGGIGWYALMSGQLSYLEFPKGRLVTQQEKQLVVAATSLVLLWLSGALVSLFFGLVSAIVVVGGHAAMRTKSLKAGIHRLHEEAKDAFC